MFYLCVSVSVVVIRKAIPLSWEVVISIMPFSFLRVLTGFVLLLLLTTCTGEDAPVRTSDCTVANDKPFSLMSCDPSSGITFSNDLQYTEPLNPYTYRNFYNGGGVGVGDFNGDGLQDVFFTGNLVENKLYLNLGDFKFEDVTAVAGVACPDSWSTGVAVVDIDQDGDQDIYVCKAGPPAGEQIDGMTGVRHNELYLNNGDATFREASAEFGLDVVGLSVHAAFFDYDDDGDLDCYLLNNSTRSTTGYDFKKSLRKIPDPEGGNKLFRNDEGQFVDVTTEAGIYSSAIGFGLGVTVGDVNEDHLPDLFVSNDFFERDYLYFNNGDGTFRENLPEYLPEISQGSMGADLADINNDGLPELFVTEMLPRTDYRRKTKAVFNSWNRYQLYRDEGYHQQFSRNVLQLNRGDGHFSEVSRLLNVEATDWSWGALLFDLNNDGYRDIFVANGNGKDLLDQDYINFDGSQSAIRAAIQEGKTITDIIDKIPEEKLVNGVFLNTSGIEMREAASQLGIDQKTFSNGAAYADLDNDGDLDLVVNNINDLAGVYRNNTANPGLTLHLRPRPNELVIGAKVYAFGKELKSFSELQPMRGFESTVDQRLHVGFAADSVLVRWPGGNWETYTGPFVAGVVDLTQDAGLPRTQDAIAAFKSNVEPAAKLLRQRDLTHLAHTENGAAEFDQNPLLLLGIGNEGPALTIGRPFRDGTLSGFLGGGPGEAGQLFLAPGKYIPMPKALDLSATTSGENVDAVWFDANGDGRDDLYVVNGGPQFGRASSALADQLYLSTGSRGFKLSEQVLPNPTAYVIGACVRPHDVDADGDLDLFVGGRMRPGLYGVPTDSYLLLNDGKGKFSTKIIKDLGMVTDAQWGDVDGDGTAELVVTREWGAIAILQFDGTTTPVVEDLSDSEGLWHTLALADLDGDKQLDIIAGNHGENSTLATYPKQKLELHVNDFDGNGRAEALCVHVNQNGERIPLSLRDDLVKHLPTLRKTIPRYRDYANMTFTDLFPEEVRAKSIVGKASLLHSAVFRRVDQEFVMEPLPTEAQLAPIYAIAVADLNKDGVPDLILGGNQTVNKPEIGINAASFGTVLINRGDAGWRALGPAETGMVLAGDVREIITINQQKFAVARSNGTLLELQFDN